MQPAHSKHVLLAVVLLLGLCTLASAADISGQWTAEVPGRGGNTQTVTFNFKADGNSLTGTVTTPRGENPISDGKIDGDTITFSQAVSFNGNDFKLNYKGVVSGDEIKFTRVRDGGEGRSQEFTAKRK